MTGQKGAETQVLIEVDTTDEGVTESTIPPKTTPETVSPEDMGSIVPKETPTVGVTEVTTVGEDSVEATEMDRKVTESLPAGESGPTGNLLARLLRFCMRKPLLSSTTIKN